MGKAKHPRPYNKGPRQQMTLDWKKSVTQKLEDNRAIGTKPANAEQLRVAVKAPKGAIERMLAPEQTASSYVGKVCEVLGIEPPLRELSREDQRDLAALAAFPPEIRRRLIDMGNQLLKK